MFIGWSINRNYYVKTNLFTNISKTELKIYKYKMFVHFIL